MELRTYLLVMWQRRWIVLTALLSTLLATMIFTILQTPVYEARSTFVVSPTGTYQDAESLAGVLDTMSRRTELANTYAEIAASRSIKEEVADGLGLSKAQRRDLVVGSMLLAGTNVLEITVQGNDAQLVALFADGVGAQTASYTRALYEAYALQPLDTATAPTSPIRPNKMLNLAMGAVLGLALGAGLAFLAHYLGLPVQEAASRRQPGTLPGSTQEGAVAARRTSRLGLAGWIVVVLLTLAIIGMGSVLFLSEPGTSAAVVPVATRPIATFVPAAVWTAAPTPTPTDATLLTPSPTLSCIYPVGWLPYEVQAIDTLTSLATRWGMSVAEVADANCLARRVISAGQILYFPPPPETPTPEVPMLEAPTPVPSMTATISVGLTPGSPTPTVLPATDTATPQGRTSPTPVSTQASDGSAATPSPAATVGASLPAPVLLAPANGAEFAASDMIVLAWEAVKGLPADGYYVITVAYSHLGQTWYDDVPWTRNTTWTMSEHDYLLGLSDDGQFIWSVQVVRRVGIDEEGTPEGVTLSDPSDSRRLIWRSGPGQVSTPVIPPP